MTRSCSADRKSTRLNSSHLVISYAVFCLKKNYTTARKQANIPPRTLTGDHVTQPRNCLRCLPARLPEHSEPPRRSSVLVFLFFISRGAPPNSSFFPLQPPSLP